MKESVNVWEEDILLPTYGIGRPEKNPMFLEKRVYQGSSGVVYPYPVIEKIEDTCEEKSYHAVWLENEYIKVMILPELGGRIQMVSRRILCAYRHLRSNHIRIFKPIASGNQCHHYDKQHRNATAKNPCRNTIHHFLHLFATKLDLFMCVLLFHI